MHSQRTDWAKGNFCRFAAVTTYDEANQNLPFPLSHHSRLICIQQLHLYFVEQMNIKNGTGNKCFYPSLLGGKRSRRKSPPLKWSGPDLSLNCGGPPTDVHTASHGSLCKIVIHCNTLLSSSMCQVGC